MLLVYTVSAVLGAISRIRMRLAMEDGEGYSQIFSSMRNKQILSIRSMCTLPLNQHVSHLVKICAGSCARHSAIDIDSARNKSVS